jgi:hypothetical protein
MDFPNRTTSAVLLAFTGFLLGAYFLEEHQTQAKPQPHAESIELRQPVASVYQFPQTPASGLLTRH